MIDEILFRCCGRVLCMDEVLFEVSYIGSPRGFLHTVMFFGGMSILLVSNYRKRHMTNTKKEYILYKIKIIGTIFFSILYLVMIFGLILTYCQIILVYKMGGYCEVEGVVENYTKYLRTETFTVDTVEFETGEAEATWGYVWQNGESVITGNGQHLRIRYIPTANTIVYIEEIAEE